MIDTDSDVKYAEEQMRKWREWKASKKVRRKLYAEARVEGYSKGKVEALCCHCGKKLERVKLSGKKTACRSSENRDCFNKRKRDYKWRCSPAKQREYNMRHSDKVMQIPLTCGLCGATRYRRRQEFNRNVRCKHDEDAACFKRYSLIKMRESRERKKIREANLRFLTLVK